MTSIFQESVLGEKDACGVGMIANMEKPASHELLEVALRALSCMEHRGACSGGMDSTTASWMTQMNPARPFSRWLSDSDVVQESPFMQRRWQSQVLLLSNFIFSLVGLCILAAWEYGYSYRLRKSRAIFYSAFSVGLMAFSWFLLWKKALDRQAFAVAGEMLTAFHIAVMFTFFGQGLSTFSLWSLLTVCFIFFLRLRAHPLSVFFFCLECLCGLHHEVGEALMKWPAVYRDGTWEEIRGHEVFTSEWKVKVAVLSAWLIVVTLWYDNSFCEKLAAVKHGLILNGSIDVSLPDLKLGFGETWWCRIGGDGQSLLD
eukprot:symbB.v1.2.028810.t1/scaffold3078.1/size64161/1